MESKRANQQITFEGRLVPSPMLFEEEQILGTFEAGFWDIGLVGVLLRHKERLVVTTHRIFQFSRKLTIASLKCLEIGMEKNFFWILFFVFAILIACGCVKTQEDYKAAIELKGITYSIDNFIEQIKKGNKEVVELFVKAGIDVNAKNEDGNTALMCASSDKLTSNRVNIKIVKLLIDNGANVNAEDKHGITALIIASSGGHTEIVKLLIDKGANVNAKFADRHTALRWASNAGYTEIVKLLKQAGAKE